VGAVLGTALLATSASTYAPAQKAAIVAAKRTGPRSMLFDKLRGQHDWPKGVDGRGLENASSREALTGLSDDEVKRRFDEAVARGEPDRLITWAGTSVAYVTDEKELGVVVQRIEAGLRKAPGDLSSLLSAAM
jgi:nitronate monooxygenase